MCSGLQPPTLLSQAQSKLYGAKGEMQGKLAVPALGPHTHLLGFSVAASSAAHELPQGKKLPPSRGSESSGLCIMSDAEEVRNRGLLSVGK